MNIGRLDRRVTLKKKSVSQDEFGQDVEMFDDLGVVWASRLRTTGKETAAGGEERAALIDERIWIMWADLGLTPADRFELDGREFDILAIREIGRREALEIDGRARAE